MYLRFRPKGLRGVLAVIGLGSIACLCAPSFLLPPTPIPDALTGYWREEAQFPCDGDHALPAIKPVIGELVFGSGKFSVTWVAFETYRDYWGTYEYDQQTGALTLSVDTSSFNFIPDDLDGEGRAEIDDQGRLVLSDMWLGTPTHQDGQFAPAGTFCGQRFIKR